MLPFELSDEDEYHFFCSLPVREVVGDNIPTAKAVQVSWSEG
jgi:hypothetical protein